MRLGWFNNWTGKSDDDGRASGIVSVLFYSDKKKAYAETMVTATKRSLEYKHLGNGDYLTIRLRARVFYEQIINEAQPSRPSLVENEGKLSNCFSINLLVVSLHKRKKCQVMRRKGLFHYVSSGSNVARHSRHVYWFKFEGGSRIQSREQLP